MKPLNIYIPWLRVVLEGLIYIIIDSRLWSSAYLCDEYLLLNSIFW